MADGSFSSGSYVRPYISAHGSPRTEEIEQGSTASTAVYKLGDLICRGATTNAHRAVLQATGVTANLTVCLGFAAEDAETSATVGVKKTLFWPADSETQFIGVAKGTLNSTQLGGIYAIRRDSTLGIAYLDLAIVSTAVMGIVDAFANGSTMDDTNGFVVFRVASSCSQKY